MKKKIIKLHHHVGQEESPNTLRWWLLLPFRFLLYLFSLIYQFITSFRNHLFDWNIFHSNEYQIPTICIGNLSVGGTGKTPHTEYLVKLLQQSFQVAVLSRGYKRKTKGYRLATTASTAEEIGDEPHQIKQKFTDCIVAVSERRSVGIEKISSLSNPRADVILLDDAYQHRQVKAGLNILLTDFNHLFCEDYLLPLGRLRESANGKERAHIVIVTKCPINTPPIEYNIIGKKLNLRPYQKLFFTTFAYGQPYALFTDKAKDELSLTGLTKKDSILIVTGIANPRTLLDELQKYTSKIQCLSFDDHHNFTKKDFAHIKDKFNALQGERHYILTTEKDASRLIDHPHLCDELKPFIYILPVEVQFLQNQQNNFNQNIISYVRKDSRNSRFS